MIRTLRNLIRLAVIARILARHDALFILETTGVAPAVVWLMRVVSRRRQGGRPGQRLAQALLEAGPSFIKLGQALSTRSDFLGEELAADLSDLQDRLPPFAGDLARATIEHELGAPIEEMFAEFENVPVAAASISQVHRAVTADGRQVAVKVLRPAVENAFSRDLDLFLWVAELMEAARPQWRRLRPVESVQTLADSVELEMDLRFEAAAAAELAQNFEEDETFAVPSVDWRLTAQRVLTLEWVSGIPIDDREAIIAAGHDPEVVLDHAAAAMFQQVFRDGFFHADLHAGNLFVGDNGKVTAVDFGIMGRIDRKTRHILGEILLAFLSGNYRRVAEVHFEAGWVPAHRSVDTFTQACRSIAEPILDRPQSEISVARLLGQLFRVTETFDMETQPQLLLLQKMMLVAEGTGRHLCPDANMWFLTRPLMEDWMLENFGPEAKLRDTVSEVAAGLSRLPDLARAVERGAASFAEGRVQLDAESMRALRSRGALLAHIVPLWVAVSALLVLVLLK